LEDKNFLHPTTIKIIDYYKPLTEVDGCVANVTYEMDTIAYLLKKPSCNKYWSAWLVSPAALQKDYINKIKKNQPKYILYEPLGVFDGLKLSERIELLNSYILSNYKENNRFDEFVILEKK
jgi:hypothetical protein